LNGRVIEGWYADGAVEFVAELDDPQAFGWIKDGAIQHCSVEYEWDNLEKVDGVAPRGITFTGLSLLKAYEPGDPATTVQVWEAIVKRLKEARGQNLHVAQRQGNTRERDLKVSRLGEAVVESSAVHDGDFVSREDVLAELRKVCYERVPKHWSYGAELQNRRLKDLIHRLESRSNGENTGIA